MKKNDLGEVRDSLATLTPRIMVPEDIAVRARKTIERMLAV